MTKNIFTHLIAEELDVSLKIAERVQDHMSEFYNLDWSEADEKLIRKTAHVAFEDLNEIVNVI